MTLEETKMVLENMLSRKQECSPLKHKTPEKIYLKKAHAPLLFIAGRKGSHHSSKFE